MSHWVWCSSEWRHSIWTQSIRNWRIDYGEKNGDTIRIDCRSRQQSEKCHKSRHGDRYQSHEKMEYYHAQDQMSPRRVERVRDENWYIETVYDNQRRANMSRIDWAPENSRLIAIKSTGMSRWVISRDYEVCWLLLFSRRVSLYMCWVSVGCGVFDRVTCTRNYLSWLSGASSGEEFALLRVSWTAGSWVPMGAGNGWVDTGGCVGGWSPSGARALRRAHYYGCHPTQQLGAKDLPRYQFDRADRVSTFAPRYILSAEPDCALVILHIL